jgi:hypothetical protein
LSGDFDDSAVIQTTPAAKRRKNVAQTLP